MEEDTSFGDGDVEVVPSSVAYEPETQYEDRPHFTLLHEDEEQQGAALRREKRASKGKQVVGSSSQQPQSRGATQTPVLRHSSTQAPQRQRIESEKTQSQLVPGRKSTSVHDKDADIMSYRRLRKGSKGTKSIEKHVSPTLEKPQTSSSSTSKTASGSRGHSGSGDGAAAEGDTGIYDVMGGGYVERDWGINDPRNEDPSDYPGPGQLGGQHDNTRPADSEYSSHSDAQYESYPYPNIYMSLLQGDIHIMDMDMDTLSPIILHNHMGILNLHINPILHNHMGILNLNINPILHNHHHHHQNMLLHRDKDSLTSPSINITHSQGVMTTTKTMDITIQECHHSIDQNFDSKILAEKLPDLLDFHKDLVSLEDASKVQLKTLAEEMQAISKGLEKVEQELTEAENDGPLSEAFRKTLKDFLGVAEAEVRSLTFLYTGVGRNADALAIYFGEDPTCCPFEQVASTLLNFVKMFGRAHEENCKQLELERKRAQKQADMEKLKTGIPKKESEHTLQSPVKHNNI